MEFVRYEQAIEKAQASPNQAKVSSGTNTDTGTAKKRPGDADDLLATLMQNQRVATEVHCP